MVDNSGRSRIKEKVDSHALWCYNAFMLATTGREQKMQNYFSTLNAALESENLLDSWNPVWSPIQYNETRSYTWEDGSKNGHYVSIYRSEKGLYERPVHYNR